MRAIAQRVREAAVAVEGKVAGQIGIGLLVLAGCEEADQPDDLEWMAQKLVKLVGFVSMCVMLVLGLMFSMVLLFVVLVIGMLAFGYFWWKTRPLRQAMKAHAAQAQPDGQVFEGEAVVIEAWQARQHPSLPSDPAARSSRTTSPDADSKA